MSAKKKGYKDCDLNNKSSERERDATKQEEEEYLADDEDEQISFPELVAEQQPANTPIVISNHRADIDGLRALAVASVVIYHLDETWLPGGFVGVDIFFVISGYVVCSSLLRRQSASLTEYFIGFYARRMKRLAPTLIIVIIASSVMLAVVEDHHIRDNYISGLVSLVGGSNIWYAVLLSETEATTNSIGAAINSTGTVEQEKDELSGYFRDWEETIVINTTETNATNTASGYYRLDLDPFSHTWSLGVEEQFYLIFPALMVLAYGVRVVQNEKVISACSKVNQCSGTVLLLPTILSFVFCWLMSQYSSTLAFYLLPSRFWQMASGVLLHWSHEVNKPFWQKYSANRIIRFSFDFTASLLIGLGIALTVPGKKFPLPWSLLAVLGTLAFITVGYLIHLSQGPGANTTFLTSPLHFSLSTTWCAYFGRLSYALYLWHWPVFVCFRLTCNLDDWGYKFAACAISVALSVVNYHAVECRVKSWKHKGNAVVLWFGVGGLLIAGSLLVVLLLSIEQSKSSTNASTAVGTEIQSNSSTNGTEIQIQRFNHNVQVCSGWCQAGATNWEQCTAPHRVCSSTQSCANCTYGEKGRLECTGSCTCPGIPPDEQEEVIRGSLFYTSDQCSELTPPTRGDMGQLVTACLAPPNAYNGIMVYLVGDSHASSYVPAFSASLARYGGNATLRHAAVGHLCGYNSKAFSDALIGTFPSLNSLMPRCHDYINTTTSILEQNLKAGDIVAVATAMYKYWGYSSVHGLNFDLSFLHELRSLVEARNASLILLDDSQKLPRNGISCVSSTSDPDAASRCLVSRSAAVQQRQAVTLAFEDFCNQSEASTFFNSFEIFCPPTLLNCSAFLPNQSTLAILDRDHWTFEGSLYVAPSLSCHLESVNPDLLLIS